MIVSPDPGPVAYKDRSVGFILGGILELLIALGCLAMLALVTFSALALPRPGVPPMPPLRAMLPSYSIYLLFAAFFGAVGVGSILVRRWARTLTLIASWMWLVVGVAALGLCAVLLPGILAKVAQGSGGGDRDAAQMVGGCVFVILAVFYLILPGIFVTFYGSRNAKATAEARDPVVRWTDRCPAPVLAITLGLGYAAFACLTSAAMGFTALFGHLLSGAPAVVLLLALAAITVVLAVAIYRLQPWSWWAATGLWLLGCLSAASFVFTPFDWRQFYAQMGMPTGQLEALGIFEILQGPAIKIFLVVWIVGSLAYLVWIRRYFRRPSANLPA